MKLFLFLSIILTISSCASRMAGDKEVISEFGCYEGNGKLYEPDTFTAELNRLRCFVELGKEAEAKKQVEYVKYKYGIEILDQFKNMNGTLDGDYWVIKNIHPNAVGVVLEKRESVQIKFTVTKDGYTDNIEIFESTNSDLNSRCIEAVRELRYLPKVINGVAEDVPGVKMKYTFYP